MLGKFFERIKDGLSKTRTAMSDKIASVIRGGKLDDDAVDEIEAILMQADVGYEATEAIVDHLRDQVRRGEVDADAAVVLRLLKEELTRQLSVEEPFSFAGPLPAQPYVVLVVGINGVGKTTTIGKMAKNYVDAGHKVLVAACDTFRAAAVPQLEVWAQRAGVDIVRAQQGADPAAVAFDAVAAAQARDIDVLLVDTAGRLHNKVNLMEELGKIRRSVSKNLPGAPHETLLVLDSTTGQNTLTQAKEFNQVTELSGLVLTKLDGTAKGGIAVALQRQMELPVKLIGVGESLEDLQPFDGEEFVEALFAE